MEQKFEFVKPETQTIENEIRDGLLDVFRQVKQGTMPLARAKEATNAAGKLIAQDLGILKACLDGGIKKDLPVLGITVEMWEEAEERRGELIGRQQMKMLGNKKRAI